MILLHNLECIYTLSLVKHPIETSPNVSAIAKLKCGGIHKVRGYKREWNRNVIRTCIRKENMIGWVGLGTWMNEDYTVLVYTILVVCMHMYMYRYAVYHKLYTEDKNIL